MFMGTHAVRLASDTWITFWTSNRYNQTAGFYLGIYAVLVATFMALIYARGEAFSSAARRAGVVMHDKLFKRIMNGTMMFFARRSRVSSTCLLPIWKWWTT